MRLLSSLALLAALTAPVAASAGSLNLSTGAVSYTVVPPSLVPQEAVFIVPNPGWGASIPGAFWIGLPNSGTTTYPGGEYDYATSPFTNYYSLSGSFASDNMAAAYLFDVTTMTPTLLAGNMYGTGPSNYSFNTVTPFSTVLNPNDSYRLVFSVMNGNGTTDLNGPTGLLAGAAAGTPEPSSLALLGTGVLGLAGAARRRFQRS